MKFFSAWLLAVMGVSSICSAQTAPLTLPQPLQSLAASSLSAAQLVPLSPASKDGQFMALAWEEEGPKVSFALLKRTGQALDVLWLTQRPEAYEPTVKQITNWVYQQRPIVALTYSQGAAARQIELWGIDGAGFKRLDDKLGEAIGWKIRRDGRMTLVVYSKPRGHLAPDCSDWDEKRMRLKSVACGK